MINNWFFFFIFSFSFKKKSTKKKGRRVAASRGGAFSDAARIAQDLLRDGLISQEEFQKILDSDAEYRRKEN